MKYSVKVMVPKDTYNQKEIGLEPKVQQTIGAKDKYVYIGKNTGFVSCQGNTYLKEVVYGPSTIASCAFKDCESLAKIRILGVSSIGAEAFAGCSSLHHIYLDNAESVPSLGQGAIPYILNLQIHVMQDMKSEYLKDSSWKLYEDYIIEDNKV